MASGDRVAIGKPDTMGVDDGRPLFNELGAGPRQILAVGVGEPADLLLLGRDEGRPVERRLANVPAKPSRVAEVVSKPAGVNIELLRHAATEDARAAHSAFFRDQSLRAMTGSNARRAHAARPCADHKEIDVERHPYASVPPAPDETRLARNRRPSSSSPRGRAQGCRSTAFRARFR